MCPGSFPGDFSLVSLNQPSHPSLPACHCATLPAQRHAATSRKDLPYCSYLSERPERNPSPLTVFFVPSSPSSEVSLTLLGISTTQPQHVVLHQPGEPPPLPCLSHAGSWCPRSKGNIVQPADEETRLAAFDVGPRRCDRAPPAWLFLQMQFAAAMLSPGNCFSRPNTASIFFYLSVNFHLAK